MAGPDRTFFAETDVTSVGSGCYRSEIAPAWNLRPLPQGGVVTALALRAMDRELGPTDQTVRTVHTMFVSPVADGPVDIDVETLRRGRTMSHLRAEVRNAGAEHGHVTTAVFGSSRAGFDFTDIAPPPVPPPSECRSFRDPPPDDFDAMEPMRFWSERVEGRPCIGHAPWEDFEPQRAETASWYRFDNPPRRDDGTMDQLGVVVLADTMPGAVGERTGRGGPRWFAPSVDLTVHLLGEWRSEWLLAHNQARFAGDGYASADMALWDCGDDGKRPPTLVAYATQVFLFRFME